MKRGWWLLLVPLVLIGALLALLGTQAGLQFSLYLARTYIPGDISVQRLEGRWLGPLQVESLQYQQEGQVYAVQQLQLDWQPMALLRGQVRVDRLHVTGVEVELGPVMPEPDEETAKPPMTPGLSLPLGIRIDDLQVDGVQVQRLAEPLAQLDRLQLAISGEGEEIQLGELTLVLPQGRLQITGSLGLGAHAQTALDMAWSADLESLQHLAGKAQLTGNWQQLQLQYALEKPASAQLDLQVREPLAGLQWQLRVQLPEGNLQRFSPAWPDLFLAGDVQAQGDNRQAQLAGRVHTDAGRSGQPYALDLNLEAEDTGDGWKLSMGRLQQPESGAVLDVSGEGMHGGYSQVTLEWQGLRWPLQDPPAGQEEPVWKSPEGTLGFSGTAKAYTLSAAARLEGSTLPPLQLKAEAKGDDQGLQLAPLHLALLDGTLDGEAQLQWQPALQWQAQLQLQNINPGRLQPEWPGTLQARLQVSGAEEKGQLQHHLQITDLSGQLRDYPLQANGQLWLAGEALRIEGLRVQSGAAQVALDARLGKQWQGQWQADIPDLAMLLPAGKGRLKGKGSLSGPRDTPRLSAVVTGQQIHLEPLGIEQLDAKVDWDMAGDWSLQLDSGGVRSGDRRLDQVKSTVTGNALAHRITLQARGEGQELSLGMQGRWHQDQWDGTLQQADVRVFPLGGWSLVAPAALVVSPASGSSLQPACWKQQAAQLCLQGGGDQKKGWQAQLNLQDYDLEALKGMLPPGHAVMGTLAADVQADLNPQGVPQSANLAVTLTPGQVIFGRGELERLTHGGGTFRGQLKGETAELSLQLQLAGEDHLRGAWTVTEALLPAARVEGVLTGEVRELGFIQAFTEAVEEVSGSLRLQVNTQGPLAALEHAGQLQLQDSAVTLPGPGLRLEDIQLALRLDTPERLTLDGRLQSGKDSELRLNGVVELPREQDWEVQLQAQGQQFRVLDTPEYRVRISPDVHVKARSGRVDLQGTLEVPYARLRPQDFSGAEAPSRDVVRIDAGEGEEAATAWAVYSDLELRLGKDVKVDGFGLKANIDGKLRLKDEPERLTTARGVLEIREGRYKAYGQDLTIETGRVLYNDSLLDNPGLDVKAARKVGEVTAGLRVTGQLRNPDLSFYSDPSMSESDTLSYLLLGRPLNQASGAESAGLKQAAAAAGLGGGGLLAAQIGDAFGLDEVELGGGADDAALMVGKYLSPRLYVQYSVGLLEPINTLRVRYEMSRRWILQTETGAESGADLIYTLE